MGEHRNASLSWGAKRERNAAFHLAEKRCIKDELEKLFEKSNNLKSQQTFNRLSY